MAKLINTRIPRASPTWSLPVRLLLESLQPWCIFQFQHREHFPPLTSFKRTSHERCISRDRTCNTTTTHRMCQIQWPTIMLICILLLRPKSNSPCLMVMFVPGFKLARRSATSAFIHFRRNLMAEGGLSQKCPLQIRATDGIPR